MKTYIVIHSDEDGPYLRQMTEADILEMFEDGSAAIDDIEMGTKGYGTNLYETAGLWIVEGKFVSVKPEEVVTKYRIQ